MDNAEEFLHIGVAALAAQQPMFDKRQRNYEGDQQLPYAPEGVSEEYQELRKQAIANWLQVAMDAPVQRMEAESISDDAGKTDKAAWADWVAFDLETRQKIVFTQMMVQSRGVMSVSKASPAVGGAKARVENSRRVYLHPDPADPFEAQFAVKMWVENQRPASGLWVPTQAMSALASKVVAVVYDSEECVRFEKPGTAGVGGWQRVATTPHGLGAIPFVAFGHNVDADNVAHTAIDQLIPMQNAINTIRFNTLLAMQFSAYRQRVATGYDPVLRDANGEIIYVKDRDGNEIVGLDGQPVPQLRPGGRVGVDRLLVFPGKDTKVFDLAESNLQNYITVYTKFLTDLFSKAQTPPQYGIDRMANLSGDALAGAESTLTSLVNDLKREANSGIRKVFRLLDAARGHEPRNRHIEWADTEPKSFTQIVDGVTKLIAAEFPRRGAYDMLPGATPTKVDQWMDQWAAEQRDRASALMLDQTTSDLGDSNVLQLPASGE
ncbi:phage portal protein [Gordonia sp. UBA6683]|uniref:phage portal protein n=1 Tax=Gordonia sp. UBA6683 TaxID=1946577 RepID=UPI0025BB7C15|nr:phage portal protein [Gordonia sp. UBA6683]